MRPHADSVLKLVMWATSVSLILILLVPSYNTLNLSTCCESLGQNESLIRPGDILECVNRSVTDSYNAYFSRTPPERAQPSLTIAMLTRMTSSIINYSAYSYLVHAAYSARNGYTLLPLRDDTQQADYVYHRKLVPLLDTLGDATLDADYVSWVDADLIPLDLDYRMEAIIAFQPRAHIYMSEDVSSLANTGFILVRNSRWARSFLRDWLALRHQSGVQTEQLGFDSLYRAREVGEMSEKVAILPAHVMNSIAAPMGEQLPHHKVLHLAAESDALRAAVFRAAAQEVCTALVLEKRTVRPQLGVDRAFLQATAVEIYGTAYTALQKSLLNAVSATTTAELFTEYRTGVSKYCYAVSYMNNRVETPETLRVRWQAHILGTRLSLLRIFELYNDAHAAIVGDAWVRDAVALDPMDQENRAVDAPALFQTTVLSVTSAALRRRITLTAPAAHGDCALIDDIMMLINPATRRRFTEALGHGPEKSGERLRTLYGELPEILKLSAELSFELLQVLLGHRHSKLSAVRDVVDGVRAEEKPASVEKRAIAADGTVLVTDGAGSGIAGTASLETVPWWEEPVVLCEVLGSVQFTLGVLRGMVHSSQMGVIEDMQRDVMEVEVLVGGCEHVEA